MYDTYIMKRTQIYLEIEQDRRLGKRASASGVTKSTLVRQAIDAFLDVPADGATHLARFRAALDEIDGSRAPLPDGRIYVEEIRAGDIGRQTEIDRRRR
ncbi:MAG: ribbon-helix-helix protein, CopG family [Chloroflexi bacterium]|nr:ribbon-helix-helix protein, CopG family [Chloroflexota bacterium]